MQRILLEGFTNVIKHAKASRVVMQARWGPEPVGIVWLSLIDNGEGLYLGTRERSGLDLASMKSRAHSLGGTQTFQRGEMCSATLCVRWPILPAEAS